jgi:hypothetical protein
MALFFCLKLKRVEGGGGGKNYVQSNKDIYSRSSKRDKEILEYHFCYDIPSTADSQKESGQRVCFQLQRNVVVRLTLKPHPGS